jgi:predicted transcriptional regulator of viral defense system
MNRKKQVLEITRKYGVVKASDIEAAGISRNYLYMLYKDGLLRKTARGLYMIADAPITEHSSFIEISKRVPHAVVCLVSALNFHQITTQIPHEVWITLPRGAWSPKIAYPPINITFMSGKAYDFGIEEHTINGSTINIYNLSKTVADCFKFRNKIGLDIAIEALKETLRSNKVTVEELMDAAKVCNVSKIMRPYLEAIV